MKKLVLAVTASFLFTFTFAQKIKETQVPSAVKQAFTKMHPTVSNVTWDKEKDQYEASFTTNHTDNSVLFSFNGMVVETETAIPVSQLPKGVMDYVKTNYKGQQVKDAAKITDAKGLVTFEVEVKKLDLLFDANGQFIKQVKE